MLGGRRISFRRGYNPDTYHGVPQSLARWAERLGDKSFLGGDQISDLDCALFGQFQCMATGLTDEVLPIIRSQPSLMAWLGRMRAALDLYDRDFTLRLVEPSAGPVRASIGDKTLFWITLLVAIIAAPMTALMIRDGLIRRNLNPHRTGRRLEVE